jgi:hypothetical protein
VVSIAGIFAQNLVYGGIGLKGAELHIGSTDCPLEDEGAWIQFPIIRVGIDPKDIRKDVAEGTLDLPGVGDVRKGVLFDGETKEGTLESTDPGVANVKDGVEYKIESVARKGTLEVVGAGNPSPIRVG